MGYLNEFPHVKTWDSDLRQILEMFMECKDLPRLYRELKEFVDNYFTDLNIQNEIMEQVNKWLDEHPEATTTVQDGSLTREKFYEGVLPYVTPEMFGAVGNGINDDTQALKMCFESGYPIKGLEGKSYLCTSTISLPNTLDVQFDGCNCKIKNANIEFNLNEAKTEWNIPYPSSINYIENVEFVNEGANEDCCIFTGLPLKLENVRFTNYTVGLKATPNYIDYMQLYNVQVYNHNGDDYAIQITGIGDNNILDSVHIHGSSNLKLLLTTYGKNPITIKNALNGIHKIGNYCMAKFENCHFESISGCECSEFSTVSFDTCFFWVSATMPQNAIYNNCIVMANEFTLLNGHNKFDFTKIKGNNNKIGVNTGDSIDYYGCVNLDGYQEMKNAEYSFLEYRVIPYEPYITDSESGKFEVGNYQYTFVQSISNDTINSGKFTDSMTTLNVNIDSSKKRVAFSMSHVYLNPMFVHVFRKNLTTNVIEKVVLSLLALNIIDFGDNINGILWERVDSIPALNNTQCFIKNGIYHNYLTNELNGTGFFVYNTNDKTFKYQ